MQRCLSSGFAFALALLFSTTSNAVLFNDGAIHSLDAGNSFPFDTVELQDGPGAATTTLNILPGGRAGTQSIGGGVTAWGNSAVNMSGGIVEGDFMSFQGQSVLNLTGGIIGTQASFFGNAEAFIWGGDLVSGAFIAGDA